jgi:hypothetical protein
MNTPSLRNVALEHFRAGQMGLVHAFAVRLGVDDHDLTPRVLAAAISEAMLAIVERWVTQGAQIEALGAMIDEAFGALRAGFGVPASTTAAPAPD